jgi:hypothetical protein
MQFERKLYEQQSSGLGLSLTKRLVEFLLHSGNLGLLPITLLIACCLK